MIVAITVTGKDRPGIIAALTEMLYQAGCNLEDVSMTVLEGEFAMICLAAVKAGKSYPLLQAKLKQAEKRLHLTISVRLIQHRLIRGEKHPSGTKPWLVSVLGKDRAGIVYHVSRTLAKHKLNITDLNSKIMGREKKTAYALVLEVDVPNRKNLLGLLKREFNLLQKKLNVTITLNPVDPVQF